MGVHLLAYILVPNSMCSCPTGPGLVHVVLPELLLLLCSVLRRAGLRGPHQLRQVIRLYNAPPRPSPCRSDVGHGFALFPVCARFLESHWFVWVTQMNHLPMNIDHEKQQDWLNMQVRTVSSSNTPSGGEPPQSCCYCCCVW